MTVGKEIRTQISSIQNTQKITSAMEMVAASKMLKAQVRMESSRPFAERIREVVGHVAQASSECRHAYMMERPVQRVGFVCVSTDRGLCGGLNTNLFKKAVASMKQWHDQDVEVDLCLFGNKAVTFFRHYSGNIVAAKGNLGSTPSVAELTGGVKVMLDAYRDGRIDRLFVVYNRFVNKMVQEPQVQQLLPFVPMATDQLKHHWDYIYEPDAESLFEGLFVRYIESQVYQSLVENNACEQAARMVAMKSATDNAGNLIDELNLVYNKARQAAITQELSEIISGAAAV